MCIGSEYGFTTPPCKKYKKNSLEDQLINYHSSSMQRYKQTPPKMVFRLSMEISTTIHCRGFCSLLLCAALLSALVIQSTDSRPALRRRESKKSDDDYDYDYPTFPSGLPTNNYTITTHPKPTENPPGCYKEVNRTWGGYTQTVRLCCDGWRGTECDERIGDPESASGAGSGSELFDPNSPCSNLHCEGNPDAFCAAVTKCGRTLPLFFDSTGRLARCNNRDFIDGQPVDLISLTCTGVCKDNPCQNLTCAQHPEALCFTSGCDCEPIWLLSTGVQVNCTSGGVIPPERSRRKRSQSCS